MNQNQSTWLVVLMLLMAPLIGCAEERKAMSVAEDDADALSKVSAPVLVLNDESEKVTVGRYLEYFEDVNAALNFEQAKELFEQGNFVASDMETPSFGFTKSTYWFALEIEATTKKSEDWLLKIAYPPLDLVDVWFVTANDIQSYHTGDRKTLSTRPIDNRNFIFPVSLRENNKTFVFIRIQQVEGDVLELPSQLVKASSFVKSELTPVFFDAFYFGVLLVMVFYNLILFFFLQDKAYLSYSSYVFCSAVFIFSLHGWGSQLLWGNNVFLQQYIFPIILTSMAISLGVFSEKLLNIQENQPKISRIISILYRISIICMFLAFFVSYSIFHQSLIVIGFVVLLLSFMVGLFQWRKGNVTAKYYCLGFVCLLVGLFLFGLNKLGVIPHNNITEYSVQFGGAIEVCLFSLALASRIRSLEARNLRIQTEAANALQHKVQARTHDLEIKTLEAQEATHIALQSKEESDALKQVADNLRKSAEDHAIELEELDKQKTVFFQNMSHELRTPLTLILNPLEEASREHEDDKNIEVAAKNSRRLLRLVNQLLDFQKLEAGKQELKLIPVDLSRFAYICGDYFASACSTKDIQFSANLNSQAIQDGAEPVYILGEVDALEKVTFNFLSNALKYTPRGGKIELGLTTNAESARLFIRDTGPGISKEGQDKLFQVFSQVDETTTRDYEGTGLGLALVKSLSEEMQGKVGVESEPGQGSTFWAEFPLCGKRKKVVDVLIVDDEEAICRSLASLLLRDEHIQSVETAQSSDAARTLLKESSFRVMICDEGLQQESGTEFLAELAKSCPDMRRVLFTGNDNLKLMEKAVNEAWVHQIILKPFDTGKLVEAITRLVQDNPLQDESVDASFEVKTWLLADSGGQTGVEDTGVFKALEEISEGAGELVLVVDDLPDMRDLIGNSLKKKNYRVATAPNGKRGVEIAHQIKPNLIITDWMMPVMSGPDLIKEVKNSGNGLSSVPIILLTAKSDEESKLIGTEVGADAFLGKPFNDQELGSMVRNLLSLKNREREVEDLNKLLIESVLKRYLPPDLVDQIVSGETSLEQEPQTMSVTVLFTDLVGFTKLTEELRAKKMARVLNQYLTVMNDVIYEFGGTIDKFIGDAIMVVFGAPTPMIPQDQTERATQCASAMQAAMEGLNKTWAEDEIPELQMRIGVHHGPVVIGTFGSEKRSDYTAIGSTVNMASRIESVCEPGEVFLSGEVCDYLDESAVKKAGKFELKGMGEVNLYKLS